MAYRAEIQIGVKGVEELTKLQKRLEGTNFKIDEINKKQSTTFGGLAQSIKNYSQQLNLAEKALSKVAAATPQETKAVNNYVTALGNANAARERQNRLIEQEIANRTGATAALKAYNAAAAAPTQRGAATTMSGAYMRGAFNRGTTQFTDPIGPISAQARTARAEGIAREAALKSQANQKEFAAQKTFQTELFNIEKQFENSLIRQRVEADNAEFDRLLKRLETEQNKLNEIDKLRAKIDKKVGEDFDKRATQAGNLRGQSSPVGGAVDIPGSPAAKARTQRNKRLEGAASNAIIGGAFPLLFGQGIGASVGGAAGGAGGGLLGGQFGFGLSLVGTALGTAFDELVKSAQDTAKALQQPLENFQKLNEKLLLFDRASAQSIDAAKELGRAEEANALIRQKIAGIIGNDGIQKFEELNDATKNYNKALGELSLKLQEFVAGPLTEFIKLITKGLTGTAFFQENTKRGSNVIERLSDKDANEFLNKLAKARVSGGIFKGGGAGNQEAVRTVIEEFEKRFPAAVAPLDPVKLTPQEKSENEIKKLKQLQAVLNVQLTALSTTDKFTKAVEKQQELQTNYDKQRADILKSYEENLGSIRESVEQRILALRIQGIQKANEIENQRAANQLSELQRINRAASQQQRGDAVAAGTRPELAATAQTIDDAFRSIAEAELSAEQQKAQIKRDAAFEVLKLELDGEKFKVQIAKQVSQLNLNTARKIEDINLNIARANEVTASNRFDLELAIAKLRLDVLNKEQESTRLQLVNLGAFEAAQQVQTVINAIRDERLKLENAKPVQQLNPLAAVGGGGVPTTGVDTAETNLIERQRTLTAERLKSIDILKATNKEAELAKISGIRIADQQKINTLLLQQVDAITAQQRILELQAEGRSKEQAVAIQQIETTFKLIDANLGVAETKLKTELAALQAVEADKRDLEIIEKIKQELQDIANLKADLPLKKQDAVENAANLNKKLSFTKELATDVGAQLSTGITDALVGAVNGTKSLSEAFQELAADILAAVGKALILKAITTAIGGVGSGDEAGSGLLGLLFRANGGPVSANQPYIVGERGPELYIPGASGSITNNDQFEAARKAMGGSNNSSNDAFAENAEAIGTSTSYTKEKVMERERIASINSNPIDVRAETTVINNVEYVTAEQFSQGMKSTARDAQAKVLSDLRNRPSIRRQVGVG